MRRAPTSPFNQFFEGLLKWILLVSDRLADCDELLSFRCFRLSLSEFGKGRECKPGLAKFFGKRTLDFSPSEKRYTTSLFVGNERAFWCPVPSVVADIARANLIGRGLSSWCIQ